MYCGQQHAGLVYMCRSLPVLPYPRNIRVLPAKLSILLYRRCQGWPSWHLGHTLAQLLQPPTASSARSPESINMQSKGTHVQISTELVYMLYGLPALLGQLGLTVVPHTMPHTQAADSKQ